MAQTTWKRIHRFDVRWAHGMAFDYGRARTVMFGGRGEEGLLADTWEWDGSRWTQQSPATVPPARERHGMAYDPVRRCVLMFGGLDAAGPRGDHWEWDGTNWTRMTPATTPPARDGAGLATHMTAGRVTLFGGHTAAGTANDTWEWDGTNWTRRNVANPPPARSDAVLVGDILRARVVLYGGIDASAARFFTDTWEWDGANWTQATPPQSPHAMSFHCAAYDLLRQRTVVFGDLEYYRRPTAPPPTWEWDGTNWTPVTLLLDPPARRGAAMTFDLASGRVLMFGGLGERMLGDTWEFDGVGWSFLPVQPEPDRRFGHGLVADTVRGALVLFGGAGRVSSTFNETWELRSSGWQQILPPTVPAPRQWSAMWFDVARAETLLFGGRTETRLWNDTWAWNGTTWTQLSPANAPSPRSSAAVAYDSGRRRAVLFGGEMGPSGGLSNETWEWDGTGWTLAMPSTVPSPRRSAAMAFDARRGVTVLFGGQASQSWYYDTGTWEWNGTNWQQRAPRQSPPVTWGHSMAFDPGRQRVVMFGGLVNSLETDAVWEWDGSDWTRRSAVGGPAPRLYAASAWDAGRQKLVVAGGATLGFPVLIPVRDTWEYGTDHPAAFVAAGAGCAGSAGVPALASTERGPWIGGGFPIDLVQPRPVTAILAVGGSRTSWGGFPLPIDLASIGMPGCFLRTSVATLMPMTPVTGGAHVDVPVPAASELLGGSWFAQALVADPAANAAGIVLSDAARATFGAR